MVVVVAVECDGVKVVAAKVMAVMLAAFVGVTDCRSLEQPRRRRLRSWRRRSEPRPPKRSHNRKTTPTQTIRRQNCRQIDAVGTKRFDSELSGDREVQRTMLELLNQLDGFTSNDNVKVTTMMRVYY